MTGLRAIEDSRYMAGKITLHAKYANLKINAVRFTGRALCYQGEFPPINSAGALRSQEDKE
jgi:hypothetical protein